MSTTERKIHDLWWQSFTDISQMSHSLIHLLCQSSNFEGSNRNPQQLSKGVAKGLEKAYFDAIFHGFEGYVYHLYDAKSTLEDIGQLQWHIFRKKRRRTQASSNLVCKSSVRASKLLYCQTTQTMFLKISGLNSLDGYLTEKIMLQFQ